MGLPTEHNIQERFIQMALDIQHLESLFNDIIQQYVKENPTRTVDDISYSSHHAILNAFKNNVSYWCDVIEPHKKELLKQTMVQEGMAFIMAISPPVVDQGIH